VRLYASHIEGDASGGDCDDRLIHDEQKFVFKGKIRS